MVCERMGEKGRMRLIDADDFKKRLYEIAMNGGDLTYEEFYKIASALDKQPTAYDVDKIVEQMEADEKELQEIIENGARDIYKNTNYGYFTAMNKAINIVKSGGITEEKKAEWKEHFANRFNRIE